MTSRNGTADWTKNSLRSTLVTQFPGAWGEEPLYGMPITRVLRSTNLDDDGHVNFSAAALRNIPEPYRTDRMLRDGDILLETSGGGPSKPVGRVARFAAPDNAVYLCSNFFRALRPDQDKVAPDFLAWLLLFIYKQPGIWNFQQQTTGIINLQTKDYLDQQIQLPQKPEQLRIAIVLDTVDAAIAQTEALTTKLKRVRSGLFHDLLTRGVAGDGQLRPSYIEAACLYQDTPMGKIPKDWSCSCLEEAADWFSGGTPDRSQRSWWNGPVPLLTPKDMKEFRLSDTSEHITTDAVQAGSRLMPEETVFIVVRGMILAHTFPVCLSFRPFAFNQDIKAVRGRGKLGNRFLAHWFVANSSLFLRKVSEATHGTKKLDMSELFRLYVGIPSPDEQEAILERLDTVNENIAVGEATLNKLTQMRTGLMADLLSGRVKVPKGIQPAEVSA